MIATLNKGTHTVSSKNSPLGNKYIYIFESKVTRTRFIQPGLFAMKEETTRTVLCLTILFSLTKKPWLGGGGLYIGTV